MERSVLKCCITFVLLCCTFTLIVTAEHNEIDNLNTAAVQGFQWYARHKPGMWLNSLLGRKKRSAPPYDEHIQLEPLIEPVEMPPPWTAFSYDEGKRQKVNFTPRLGRESGEENDPVVLVYEWDATRESRSPFSPRLGRRGKNLYFDPRLGKRNAK